MMYDIHHHSPHIHSLTITHTLSHIMITSLTHILCRYVAIRELISFHLGYEILYSYPDIPPQPNGKEEKNGPDALGKYACT